MTELITSTGFICQVDENCLDDMEMLEQVVEVDKGNVLVIPDMLVKLLGAEGKQALYNHVRTADGRVPMTACAEEIASIFNELQESGKK